MGHNEHREGSGTPVSASASGVKVAVVDPVSLQVVWSSVSLSAADDATTVLPLHALVPMAEVIDLENVLLEVAATGVPRRLEADLIASSRGIVTLVVTVHRIPRELLLIVVEPGWRARKDAAARGRSESRPQG